MCIINYNNISKFYNNRGIHQMPWVYWEMSNEEFQGKWERKADELVLKEFYKVDQTRRKDTDYYSFY